MSHATLLYPSTRRDSNYETPDPQLAKVPKYTRARMLLEKLLDLEQPEISSPMVTFMENEGILELLLSFVIQVDIPKQNVADTVLFARAHKTVELITDTSKTTLTPLFLQDYDNLVSFIFRAFEPSARCNMFHFLRIFEFMYEMQPQRMLEIISKNNMISYLINNLHSPPIREALYKLIDCPKCPMKAKARFHNFLKNEDMMVQIAHHIFNDKSSDSLCFGSKETFVRLYHSLSGDSCGGSVLSTLASTDEPFIENIFLGMFNSKQSYVSRLSCSELLYELFCLTSTANEQAKTEDKITEGSALLALLNFHKVILNVLREHFSLFNSYLMEEHQRKQEKASQKLQLSAFTVRAPFSVLRMSILELLTIVLKSENEEFLPQISNEAWRVLVTWFFEYKFNNFYHNTFLSLFSQLLTYEYGDQEDDENGSDCNNNNNRKEQDNRVILLLFNERYKMLDKMLKTYCDDQRRADNRGHIFKLINILNEFRESFPNSLLAQNLNSHLNFSSFISGPFAEEAERLRTFDDVDDDQ
eukprot:gb/GECH01010165.1/.p1 GENE.gb/GECH01010165.1/~~gb/GECH01010165.1/.p1  ORF type:complete len:529 (+),score=128.34 gb/GECH01010165.1/:1-1587(+)